MLLLLLTPPSFGVSSDLLEQLLLENRAKQSNSQQMALQNTQHGEARLAGPSKPVQISCATGFKFGLD